MPWRSRRREASHRRPADRHLPGDLGLDHAAARRQAALHDGLGQPFFDDADQVGNIDGFESIEGGLGFGHGKSLSGAGMRPAFLHKKTRRDSYIAPRFFKHISTTANCRQLTIDA